jgi:signal transduction histidine kinase
MTDGPREFEQLCGRILARQEESMALLARQLHDHLGGVLTAARMDLSWLQQRLPDMGPDFLARAAALDAGLAEAMNLNRGAVETLRPVLLDHFGLPVALRHLFEEACATAGTKLSLVLPDAMRELPMAAGVAIYRVAQEALDCLVARPGSRHVDVVLEIDGALARLSVEDDNPAAAGLLAAARRDGHLASMRARVGFYGGTLASTTPAGLAMVLDMPLSAVAPA